MFFSFYVYDWREIFPQETESLLSFEIMDAINKKNHFVNNIGNFFLMYVFSTNKALSKDEMISLECLLWHTSKKKQKKASYLPEKKEGKYCPCEVISLIKDFSWEFKQLYIYHTFKYIVNW